MPKKNYYKKCCEEIIKIVELFPQWNIIRFIKEEELDITEAPLLYNALKEYRERLELENHVICDDDETKKIMAEGLRIHSLIIKEQLYGNEED